MCGNIGGDIQRKWCYCIVRVYYIIDELYFETHSDHIHLKIKKYRTIFKCLRIKLKEITCFFTCIFLL